MLKKMMLLAAAVAALAAFALPAAASAAVWKVNGVNAGATTAKGVTVDGTGTLSATTTIPGLGSIELGPCLVHIEGTLWNAPTAVGHITKLEITGEHKVGGVDLCQVWNMTAATGTTTTTLCDITSASTNTTTPWPITAGTAATGVKIEGANFTDKFSAGCPLGAEGGASGTATGTWNNAGLIEFNDDGDMKGAAGNLVFLDGSVTVTGKAAGEKITLE